MTGSICWSPEGTTEHHQTRVDSHFSSASQEWMEIYEDRSVYGVIHQERLDWALNQIDALSLPSDAHVLEIGSGAGLTSAALAQRGFRVTAIDSAAEMVELTNGLARDRGYEDRISASVADAQELPFADSSFAVVIALGVLPWVPAPERALKEMARLVVPGGYVLTNVDSVLRMHYLLDPRLNPAFQEIRCGLRRILRRMGVMLPARLPTHLEASRSFDASMARLGLDKVVGASHGFGPFTFMGRPVFSDASGVRLHHLLQGATDDGLPILRALGSQYFVLARKSHDAQPGVEGPPG